MPLILPNFWSDGTMALRCTNKIRSANNKYSLLYMPTNPAGRTRGNTPEVHYRLMPKSPPIKSDEKNTSPARATLPAQKHSPVEVFSKPRMTLTNTNTRTSCSWTCAHRVQSQGNGKVSPSLTKLGTGASKAACRVSKMPPG